MGRKLEGVMLMGRDRGEGAQENAQVVIWGKMVESLLVENMCQLLKVLQYLNSKE